MIAKIPPSEESELHPTSSSNDEDATISSSGLHQKEDQGVKPKRFSYQTTSSNPKPKRQRIQEQQPDDAELVEAGKQTRRMF